MLSAQLQTRLGAPLLAWLIGCAADEHITGVTQVVSVEVRGSSSVERSQRITLEAKAIDEKGAVVDGPLGEWTSSDADVAPVTSAGIVTGLRIGRARITASIGEGTGSLEVTVRPTVGTVSVFGPVRLMVGRTGHYRATVLDEVGGRIDTAPVEWSVFPTDRATIAADGTLEPRMPGRVQVTAEVKGHRAYAATELVLNVPSCLAASTPRVPCNLSADPGWQYFGDVSGERVVWEDAGSGFETRIMLLDLTTSELFQISPWGGYATPSILGTTVVYSRVAFPAHGWDVEAYDIPTNTTTLIGHSDCGSTSQHVIWGHRVVWNDCLGGDPENTETVIYDLEARRETRIRARSVVGGFAGDGERLFWLERGALPWAGSLYVRDLVTGDVEQLTTGDTAGAGPLFLAGRLFWGDRRGPAVWTLFEHDFARDPPERRVRLAPKSGHRPVFGRARRG